MKKQIEYHEVEIRFVVRKREAARVRGEGRPLVTLSRLLAEAITGNGTNGLDAEEIEVTIDGKQIR